MQASTLITRTVGWAAGVFQTIESVGETIPDGPVLVVANHPNALLDPLVIFRVAGRPTRPLAKAPLFDQKFVGTLLRGLGGLPVYRTQDDPTQMHRNEDTFRGAIAALRAGDAVQIYPEGRSHSEPSLVPMRTGAARIALGAEAESGWTLGLRIVPIGLTYRGKERLRGRVLASIAEPFTIAHLRALHESDPVAAVRELTDEIAARLDAVTLNVAGHRDADLIDAAERLYAREKGVTGWRTRDALAERLPRLRAFAHGLAWLRDTDPARHQRLARAVSHYRRRTEMLGAHDGDVPPRYTFRGTLRYIVVQAALLVLLAPLALIGTVIWYPTYLAPRFTLRMARPDFEGIATYKLATGFLMVPLTVALGIVVAGVFWGWRGAVAAALLVPLSGFAALVWHGRWQAVRQDATLFFRVLFRRDHRDRLAAERARLTAEFDELVRESGVLEASRAPVQSAAT
ncbi:MAG TPA: 1-acyl-sn-glycerol-3-phosphate acyltransferase [Longimicrobiales bacterium]|nr:1-acyl-sn-glycerol-3-phosphate acyltransferase [Longimicrobiales bacterium]